MQKLSITTAWNETLVFVKREAGLLFPIAFGLMALPMVFLQLLAPRSAPGQEPEAGLWMLLIFPLMFLSVIASVAISALATGRETVVGEALKRGVRRFLPLLGGMLLIGFCVMAMVLVLVVVAQASRTVGVSLGVVVVIGAILLWVRLMLMTPVAAAEAGGPIALIKRSLGLTSGHTGKLLGFVILIFILGMVAGLALVTVGGILIHLLAGKPEPGSIGLLLVLLLSALLNTVFLVFFTVLVARIYAQLAGQPTSGT
ncbi:MAG TPA: hypothetical protein VGR19_06185 [Allosphingosinicella sp.]|nr:hypothetical protein [Allosphingosinicella sp.]